MTNEINVNQDVVLLPSATRTAQATSADQDNPCWRGCKIFLNVTQASGTGGLTLAVDFKDPASGLYRQAFLAAAAVTAVTAAPRMYTIFPGTITAGDDDGNASGPLPRTWRVRVVVGDSSSYTYSVGCSLVK